MDYVINDESSNKEENSSCSERPGEKTRFFPETRTRTYELLTTHYRILNTTEARKVADKRIMTREGLARRATNNITVFKREIILHESRDSPNKKY